MRKEPAIRNVLISFNIMSVAGRDQLAGIFRYLREKPNWMPRLLPYATDLTPKLVRHARAEKIDGILANHIGSPETEAALAESDVPLALIGVRSPKLDARTRSIAFIRNDNVETGRIAARHFLSLGNFRSYGYITAVDAVEKWSKDREIGFREELARHRLASESFSLAPDSRKEDVHAAFADWLKALPKPAAILAAWDNPGIWALQVCRAERIRVPHDIAVLGVDNDQSVCDTAVPPLSSIPFDYEQEGYESAAALDTLLKDPCREPKPLIVDCKPLPVFIRESAAKITPASHLIKEAQRYISKNATRGISSRDVAKALGISQSLLTLRFREYANTTVMDALISARLEKVRHLLKSTNRSIREITQTAGFRNANYLKAVFKRTFGLSMREYRATKRSATAATAGIR